MSKKVCSLLLTLVLLLSLAPMAALAAEDDPLSFRDAAATNMTVTVDGAALAVTMYEDCYVSHPTNIAMAPNEDGIDQKISIYVPENAGKDSPILFCVNNAGWQSDAYSQRTQLTDGAEYVSTSDSDKLGAALSRGFVIVSYGCRSRNNGQTEGEYLGHSPATMTDTKAAIRYLRYNAQLLPAGDVDRIVITGTSGGGGLSTVIAASGNSADFFPSLYEIGAAGITKKADGSYSAATGCGDEVLAVIAYCPINDLGYADAAYEWTYHDTREQLYAVGKLSYSNAEGEIAQEQIMAASEALKADYAAYVDSLGLVREDGTSLTSENLEAAIRALIVKEIEEAIDEYGYDRMLYDLGYGKEPVEIPQFTDEELEALEKQVNAYGMRMYKAQLYGYQVDGSGNVIQNYPNQTMQSLRIYNAYKPMASPITSAITRGGFAAKSWLNADFYKWGNESTGQPVDQCKYSYYGYIRCDDGGNLWIVREGALTNIAEFAGFPNASNLPPVRYILPYPGTVIQRSSGEYKNYYGY